MVEVVDSGQIISSAEATATIQMFESVLRQVRFETSDDGAGRRVIELVSRELLTVADVFKIAFVEVENNPKPPVLIPQKFPFEFVEKEDFKPLDVFIQVREHVPGPRGGGDLVLALGLACVCLNRPELEDWRKAAECNTGPLLG